MTRDYLLGLLTLPGIALVVGAFFAIRNLIVYRIQRMNAVGPHLRAKVAARLFATRRAYYLSGRNAAVVVVIGRDRDICARAEAVLLDEFVPLDDDGEPIGVAP